MKSLRHLNPLTWIAGNAVLIVFLLLWHRPLTPALSLVMLILIGCAAGIGLRDQWRRVRLFLALSALWLLTSALFYAPLPGETLHVWLRLGPLALTLEGATWGALRALRLLNMVAFASLVLDRVRPDDLALSLAQDLKVPYRYAFTLQAAYRMIPSLSEDAEQIRRAQAVRGAPTPRGVGGQVRQWVRIAGPLLALSLRRADRLAQAMESRGFGAFPTRTYRRRIGFHGRDAVALLGWILLLLALTSFDRRSG